MLRCLPLLLLHMNAFLAFAVPEATSDPRAATLAPSLREHASRGLAQSSQNPLAGGQCSSYTSSLSERLQTVHTRLHRFVVLDFVSKLVHRKQLRDASHEDPSVQDDVISIHFYDALSICFSMYILKHKDTTI
jgi:hypothetical protein